MSATIEDFFTSQVSGTALQDDPLWERLYDGGSATQSGEMEFNASEQAEVTVYGYDGGNDWTFFTRTDGGGTFPNDQFAEAEFVNDNSTRYIGVRLDSNGDGYVAQYGGGVSRLHRIDAGVTTQIASNFPTVVAGTVIRIEATGSTIRLLEDGVERHSVTDATHTSGAPGLAHISGTGGLVDDFKCTGPDLGSYTGPELVGSPWVGRSTETVEVPEGVQSGEGLLLIFYGRMFDDDPDITDITAPGWTKVGQSAHEGGGGTDERAVAILAKAAEADDIAGTATYAMSTNGPGPNRRFFNEEAAVFRTSVPVEVDVEDTGIATHGGATWTIDSMTPTVAQTMALAVVGVGSSSPTHTPPSPYSLYYDDVSGSMQYPAIAYAHRTTTTAVPSGTWTQATNHNRRHESVVVKEVSSGTTATATTATATATGIDATAVTVSSVTATATTATATATGIDATATTAVDTTATATTGAATGAANGAQAVIAPQAGSAAATGAGNSPTGAVTATATPGAASGAGINATASTASDTTAAATTATATGTANNANAHSSPQASTATATATGNDGTATTVTATTAVATVASGTGAAVAATAAIETPATTATATGTGNDGTAAVASAGLATAGTATATGAAQTPAAAIETPATTATATGTGFDATATTAAISTATATTATATGTANNANGHSNPVATTATAAATALDATANTDALTTATATTATATANGLNATPIVITRPTTATATALSYQASTPYSITLDINNRAATARRRHHTTAARRRHHATMLNPTTIQAATIEKFRTTVTTTNDPTGTAPSFAVAANDEAPTTWVDGTWGGTFDTTTGRISAISPTIGATGDLAIAAGNLYDLYVRWNVGGDTPIDHIGLLRVN